MKISLNFIKFISIITKITNYLTFLIKWKYILEFFISDLFTIIDLELLLYPYGI